MPAPDCYVQLRWRKDGNSLRYQVRAPAGYQVSVKNHSELELIQLP